MQRVQFGNTTDLTPVVHGATYRATHRASVVAILGDEAPRVVSKGNRFYNADRWTLRMLVKHLCDWAKKNPKKKPTRKDLDAWLGEVNNFVFPPNRREIVIANTPDVLPMRTALALVGGAYHEALHTKYSCRHDLWIKAIETELFPRWDKVADWSKYAKALLEWSNIVEDIRIERRGCETYDGIYSKMCDLHDFVLFMEEEGRRERFGATGQGPSALSVIMCAFRDKGKGYPTDKQDQIYEFYAKAHPDAFDLVANGPLAPLVEKASTLSNTDDMGNLWVAMDVIIALEELGQEQPQDQDSGDGEMKCPKCGADETKLQIRPKAGDPSKGILKCKKCGHTEEVDMDDSESSDESKPSKADIQGFDKPESKSGKSDKSDKSDKESGGDKSEEKSEGKSGKSKSESSEGDDADGADAGEGEDAGENAGAAGEGEGQDGEGSQAGAGSGSGKGTEDGDDGTGAAGQGEDGDDGEGAGQGQAAGGADAGDTGGSESTVTGTDGMGDEYNPLDRSLDTEDDTMELGDEGNGGNAGGHKDTSKAERHDWSGLAEEIQKELDAGKTPSMTDISAALEKAVQEVLEKENKGIKAGERPWRPYDTSKDIVRVVTSSGKGREYDSEQADIILKSVKAEIAYLRSRMRTMIKSIEMTGVSRGVEKGRRLSTRYLVETRGAVAAGEKPKRAFDRKGDKVDMTMACAVVLDQSGSMKPLRRDATRIMMALCEPLDAMNAPTLALGFRDHYDSSSYYSSTQDTGDYHRRTPICYDIFKGFNERFRAVKWRFANTIADGGTPMSDGVQYALSALSARKEAHRILFVVTDGVPNSPHEQVMNHQIRLANEAGIHVIGVGIGYGAHFVQTTFKESVFSNSVAEFPKLLMAKINEIIDMQATKRGTLVKDTSK